MSNQSIQTVSTGSSKVMLPIAILLLIVGVVGYGVFPQLYPAGSESLRWGILAVGVIAGFVLGLLSAQGRRFIGFAKDSYAEVLRVVWPTRHETVVTTGIVFAFVIILAIFLWLTDKSIEWILYDLIFGWETP